MEQDAVQCILLSACLQQSVSHHILHNLDQDNTCSAQVASLHYKKLWIFNTQPSVCTLNLSPITATFITFICFSHKDIPFNLLLNNTELVHRLQASGHISYKLRIRAKCITEFDT